MSVAVNKETRDSGCPWLGNVPERWAVERLKFRMTKIEQGWSPQCDGRQAEPGEWGVLKVGCMNSGVYVESENKALPPELEPVRSYEIKVGDVLMSRSNTVELVGAVGRVHQTQGRILLCDKLYRLDLDDEVLHSGFAVYLLRSHAARLQLERDASGASPSMKNISNERVANMVLAFPSIPEQRAIAAFLDRKTAQIDAVVAKKQRLIERLLQKRQALISHAITKGLDPHAPMKDSGIEWLGQIPAHWNVMALKRAARDGYKTFTDGDWIESPFVVDDGIRLLQTGNVGIGYFKEQGFRYVSEETFKTLRCTEVSPRDVLICRLDGPVGRACLAPDLGVRMITSVDNAILKTSEHNDPRFLVYLLSLTSYLQWVGSLCRVGGGHRLRVSRSMLGDFRFAFPKFSEQKAICDNLDSEAAKLETLTRRLEQQITKLQEYRQTLISAAVTGKINVAKEAAC